MRIIPLSSSPQRGWSPEKRAEYFNDLISHCRIFSLPHLEALEKLDVLTSGELSHEVLKHHFLAVRKQTITYFRSGDFVEMIKPNKRYAHDCNRCEFLGNFLDADLYVCRQFGGVSTYLARSSNESSDYWSGDINIDHTSNIRLYAAKLIAMK